MGLKAVTLGLRPWAALQYGLPSRKINKIHIYLRLYKLKESLIKQEE